MILVAGKAPASAPTPSEKVSADHLLEHIDSLIPAAHGAHPCVLAAHQDQQIQSPAMMEVTAAAGELRHGFAFA
jgi:hypothetical protein